MVYHEAARLPCGIEGDEDDDIEGQTPDRAKRHYDDAAVTAYWRARMHKELMNALGR